MLVVNQGRAKSLRSVSEMQGILNKMVSSMTPEERAAFQVIMKQMASGETELFSSLETSQYDREVVSMRQFLEDDYYMGISAKTLYPKLKQDLIDFSELGPYSEVVLGGAIGIGKSFVGTYLMCRILYEVSCLRSPQESYGLSKGSEIHMVLLSKNLHLARQVLMASVMEKVRISPYFVEHFPFEDSKDNVKFPKGVVLQIGSAGSERVLGLNVFSMLLDEGNFQTGSSKAIKTMPGEKASVSNYDQAEKVYSTLDRRIKSRFMHGGRVPGLSVLMSSKTTRNSFLERRIAAAKSDSSVFVREYAPWEVKPGAFQNKWFKVLCGNQTARSRILKPDETVSQEFLDDTSSYIIDVPEEYRVDFERDLNRSIQDIAGVATDSLSSFISRQETIFNSVRPELRHPFSVSEWVFGTPGGFVWGQISDSSVRRLSGGHEEVIWKPKKNPAVPRHVHIDTSLSGDSTGLAMGHITRYVEVIRRDPDGEQYAEQAPEIEIDLILRVIPPTGEQIFLPDVRRLVYELQEHGFQIGSFSCDSYQSSEMLQQVKARGIRGEIISVDTSPAPYEKLKSAMYEGRLRVYHYQPFIDEMLSLERTEKGKIDHPVGGCFTLDTMIRLADGSSVSLGAMIGSHGIMIRSFDGVQSIAREAVRPRITKWVTELVEVTLETGEKISCTPDHLWLLSDGTYLEAGLLTTEHVLMTGQAVLGLQDDQV